jgi:hypothetical protein
MAEKENGQGKDVISSSFPPCLTFTHSLPRHRMYQ